MLFHLGVLDQPPTDPRRRPGLAGHYSGVAEPLRGLLLGYCAQAAATRAPATVKAIASHLAGFGRFLSACDPPVTDLAALDRRAHIEPWLASLAAARHPDGRAHSLGHRRGQILTVRQFLADITEWGWPAPRPGRCSSPGTSPTPRTRCPATCPPDADRRLAVALEQLSASGPSPLARLHADALLLTRATGLRLGELRDLELDCVHQIDGHGAWLKVPLGKLGTERMVPLDDETLVVAGPDRRPAHPRPGAAAPAHRPADRVPARPPGPPGLRAGAARRARPHRPRRRPLHDHPACAAAHLRHRPGQRRGVVAGADAAARARLRGDEPALRPAVRHHRARRVRTRPHPGQGRPHRRPTGRRCPRTDPSWDGPPTAGAPLPLVDITGGRDWRDTPTIKSRLAGGFCLRAPAQGSCAYANICEHCPNFRTDAGFLAVLGAQRADAAALAADAAARGWADEANRHRRLADRLDQLISHAETP